MVQNSGCPRRMVPDAGVGMRAADPTVFRGGGATDVLGARSLGSLAISNSMLSPPSRRSSLQPFAVHRATVEAKIPSPHRP